MQCRAHSRQDDPENADEVVLQEAVMLAMRNLMRYRECSAVSGEGVEGAFMSIIKGEFPLLHEVSEIVVDRILSDSDILTQMFTNWVFVWKRRV